MSPGTRTPTWGKALPRVGWALSIVTLLFMLFDAGGKILLAAQVVEATTKIGYPVQQFDLSELSP